MQLFSVDTKIFKEKIILIFLLMKTPSKVAYFTAQIIFFSALPTGQKSAQLKKCYNFTLH